MLCLLPHPLCNCAPSSQGVQLRAVPAHAQPGAVGPESAGSSASRSTGTYPFLSTGQELLEWHPDRRPGLLELPSRLLFGGGT